MLEAIVGAWLLLFLGDFLSTFIYHIPEHVFGSLHLKTHHSSRKDFRYYAILTLNFYVFLDGILGALPYLVIAVIMYTFSPIGVISGLFLGQFYVLWRHATILGWHTPNLANIVCKVLFITTPERHWLHHRKTNFAFGDIFTFFEQPAQTWLPWLRLVRLRLR